VLRPVRTSRYLIAVLATLGSLNGASVVAAQSRPGGPCTIVSDAVIAPAHAIQGLDAPGVESCAVQDAAGAPIAIFHISGPIDPDDIAVRGTVPAAPAPIESMPVDGIGDSAVLVRVTIGDKVLVSLRVQHGDDVFAFNAADSPETPDRLVALAKAVLGGAPADGF
jgi:hypothetical protein